MSIIFRDRSLKPNESYHHYCEECGVELHPDLAYSHKCNPLDEYAAELFGIGGKPTKKEKQAILKKLKEAK